MNTKECILLLRGHKMPTPGLTVEQYPMRAAWGRTGLPNYFALMPAARGAPSSVPDLVADGWGGWAAYRRGATLPHFVIDARGRTAQLLDPAKEGSGALVMDGPPNDARPNTTIVIAALGREKGCATTAQHKSAGVILAALRRAFGPKPKMLVADWWKELQETMPLPEPDAPEAVKEQRKHRKKGGGNG